MVTIFRPLSGVNSPRTRITLPVTSYTLSSTPVYRSTGVLNVTSINLDRLIGSSSISTFVTDYQTNLLTFGGFQVNTPTWVVSNTNIGVVDTNGFVTYVSSGSLTLSAIVSNSTVATLNLGLTSLSSSTIVNTLCGYVTGSAAKNVSDAIDNRITNKFPNSALNIFTTQNHAASSYVRNVNCWAFGLDLTSISPWNSVGGQQLAGTLISPRHVIFAAHYQPPVGALLRFIRQDNTIVQRTLTNKLTHPSYIPYFPDITIGVLDSDVPSGITFAKLLPSNWGNYFPSLCSARATVPALCLDQEEKALITDVFQCQSYAAFTTPNTFNKVQRTLFYESKIGGDSGNPAFLIINNELVLLTVWTFGGAGSGTFLTPQISAINAMMTSLGGGYQVTTINLSSFNFYS